ncbi:unnamed protein product [Nesidiocoris tenuis]|uniref:Uncharacterized protein n=1 Tax=Nesidiocoris tenuis TaxID=355587 RepID=A0A6H5HIJ4_9HEMI|nr:unnamed protein product [Nesidiocoris tenuis]
MKTRVMLPQHVEYRCRFAHIARFVGAQAAAYSNIAYDEFGRGTHRLWKNKSAMIQHIIHNLSARAVQHKLVKDIKMDETPTGEEAPGISPAKRPIVLGVVDISGLKRSASNRKRRWDQPPCDDSEDIPTKILATDDEKESDEKAESKADCSVGLVPLDSQISDPSSSHADLNPLEEVVPSNVLGTNIDPQTAEEPTIADGIRRNRFDDKAEEARDFRDGKLDAEILLESVLPSDSSKSSTAITDYSEPLSNVAKGEIRFLTSQLSSPLENKELVNESKKAEPSDDTPDSLAQNSSAREPAFSKNSPPVSGGKSEHKIEDATLHLDDVLNVTKSDASTEKAKKPIENSVTLEAIPKDDTTNQDERSNSRSIEQNSQEMVDFEDWGTLKQGTSFMPVSKADDPFDSKCSLDMSLPMPGDDTSEIAQSKDVTMHFASLRSEDNVQKEEEATANEDALKLANPELTNAMKQFEEQAKMDTNTMDMLDSLVRRSSMEQSETVVEEDSLINEINLLPDREDEDTKQSDQGEDSTKPVTTSDSDNRTRLSDIPVSVPDKSRTTDGSSNGGESETEAALGSTPVQKCPIISDVESASKHSLQEQSHFGKTESQAQIEDDLSQGGEEETKAPSVTSANILEVIFGSEQKDDYAALESADSDSESKAVSVISDSRAVHSPEDGKTKSPVMASVDMQVDEDNENDEIFANAHEEPINGSPLQLADEQVQNADTEIVTVDPTAAISGEESNNDVYEIPSRDRSPITIELSDSTGDQIMVMTEASEKRIDIGATGVSDEDIDFESALDDELSFADNVLPSASSVKDLIVEEMEVDDDEEPEKKSVEEPPKEESVKSSPKLRLKITKESAEIIRDDDTIREPVDEPDREVIPRRLEVKPANSPKSLSAKEPHVPVLVIKKTSVAI